MKRIPVRTVMVAGIAALLLGLTATPAIAVPTPPRALPAGSSMYAVSCGGPVDLRLVSVDPVTAAATTIGTGANLNNSTCAGQSAWDAITHTAYYVALGTPDVLVSLDPATGVSTEVAPFTGKGGTFQIDAIAIGTDGTAYAISSDDDLYSVVLSTGELIPVGSVTDPDISGFTVDPTSGEFFTIDHSGLISSVDITNGELTTIGQTAITPSNGTFSLQIDSNGMMWVESDDSQVSQLWSVDRTDVSGSGILSGTIAAGGTSFNTRSLLSIPGTAVAPVITSAPPAASMAAGSAVSFSVATSGTTPVTFSISAGALPTGLTLDPATGVISGTPTASGSFTYTVTATNGAGTVAASYTQLVTAAPVPTPTPTSTATPSTIHLPVVSG